MKCGYSHCKLGCETDKINGVKVGKRWWHKECIVERDLKSEIEKTYYEKFQSKEPIASVRKAINNYIYRDNYDVEYVLWCLKNKATKLNSLHGLSYTLSYKQNETEFNKLQAKKLTLEFGNYDNDDYLKVAKIEPKKVKRWADFLGGNNE